MTDEEQVCHCGSLMHRAGDCDRLALALEQARAEASRLRTALMMSGDSAQVIEDRRKMAQNLEEARAELVSAKNAMRLMAIGESDGYEYTHVTALKDELALAVKVIEAVREYSSQLGSGGQIMTALAKWDERKK